MSLPPIDPDTSVAGITVDPKTLDRVIPESKRPDGSLKYAPDILPKKMFVAFEAESK